MVARPRILAPQRLYFAKREFAHILDIGSNRLSSSSRSSTLHLVPKSTPSSWRPCGAYRGLNNATVPDRYPIPHDFSSRLSGTVLFSKIYLVKPCHQTPVAPDDINKMVIISPLGLYEFVPMLYGLRNAPQAFQRFIHQVIHGLHFCLTYLGDLLLSSASEQARVEHIRLLFERLAERGVIINPGKCLLMI